LIPEIDRRVEEQSPDLLSRGALEMTYKMLRSAYPSLALAVRNLLIKHTPQGSKPSSSQALYAKINISLDASTIGKIVSALTNLGEKALENKEIEGGKLVVLRSLIEDWASLAEWILAKAEGVPTSP